MEKYIIIIPLLALLVSIRFITGLSVDIGFWMGYCLLIFLAFTSYFFDKWRNFIGAITLLLLHQYFYFFLHLSPDSIDLRIAIWYLLFAVFGLSYIGITGSFTKVLLHVPTGNSVIKGMIIGAGLGALVTLLPVSKADFYRLPILLWFAFIPLKAISEEIFFRGMIQEAVSTRLSWLPGMVFCVILSFVYLQLFSVVSIFIFILMQIALCILYARYRSVLVTIPAHIVMLYFVLVNV